MGRQFDFRACANYGLHYWLTFSSLSCGNSHTHSSSVPELWSKSECLPPSDGWMPRGSAKPPAYFHVSRSCMLSVYFPLLAYMLIKSTHLCPHLSRSVVLVSRPPPSSGRPRPVVSPTTHTYRLKAFYQFILLKNQGNHKCKSHLPFAETDSAHTRKRRSNNST